ncbi:MAG: geranylgeranyl reductase family protein [Candidatus Diapherotrites archaeon]|nr:geranylgeranyl reductase family protein [Candidatus Diapherotrites archaeon]
MVYGQESNSFDVIVVGGGPGGSTTASFLADKYNKRVLLLEKETFPRDKTCGDAISGKSMSVLADLGIQDKIEKVKHLKSYGVILSSPKGTILDIPFKSDDPDRHNYGYVCPRLNFDNIVFQHAKSRKNVTTIEKFSVSEVLKEGEQVVGVKGKNLVTGKEQEFRAKLVVGSDGATSVVARSLNLEKIEDKHWVISCRAYYDGITGMKPAIEIHFIKSVMPGYFWIFPTSTTEANVGIGMLASDMKKNKVNLEKAMYAAIENEPLFKERFKNAKIVSPVKGWNLPLGSKIRTCAGNGFLLVGDAACLIDPFSGEGIGNAMYSGRLAAQVIHEAFEKNDFTINHLKTYQNTLHKELDYELKTSYYLQRLGTVQFFLNWVIAKAARSQSVRDTLSGMLANTKAKGGLVNPLFYLKLLFA